MKKSLLYLVAIFFVAACAQNKSLVIVGTDDQQLSFDYTFKNLGVVEEGEKVKFEYTLTNTGKLPIQILNAIPTCGCITVSFPKEAFTTKQKGKISVVYDSEGKRGKDKKAIVVQTNLPYPNDIVELWFEAEIKTKKE